MKKINLFLIAITTLALAGSFVVELLAPGTGTVCLAGTAIVMARFTNAKEVNAYSAKGIKATNVDYASTSTLVPPSAFLNIVNYAQLTGAMTINITVTNLLQGDELLFVFEADSTQRVVTFGTGFISSGTLTVTAAKGATVRGWFDGTNVRIYAREIYA